MCVVRSRLIILCFVVCVAVFIKDRCCCPFGMSDPSRIVLDEEKMAHNPMELLQAVFSKDPGDSALLPVRDKVHLQPVLIQCIGVEHADGFVSFALSTHCDKGKPSGFVSLLIHDERNGSDFPRLRKQSVQFFVRGQPGKISHRYLDFHNDYFLRADLFNEKAARP